MFAGGVRGVGGEEAERRTGMVGPTAAPALLYTVVVVPSDPQPLTPLWLEAEDGVEREVGLGEGGKPYPTGILS